MTMWLLHQPLAADEETRIGERTQVTLPFNDAPDLVKVGSQQAFRKLLQEAAPDDPPETISRRVEKIWKYYEGMQAGDLIAVPLVSSGEVAMAEVTGRYHFTEGSHTLPVTWYAKRAPLKSLAKQGAPVDIRPGHISEITDAELRNKLRSHLPYRYNRFARWKWIMAIFFLFGLMRVIMRSQ